MSARDHLLRRLVLAGICLIAVVGRSDAVQAAAWPMQQGVTMAGWVCAHGHSGHVESEGAVSTPQSMHFGWGLDFELPPTTPTGATTWVHYSVPVPLFHKTRHINVCFKPFSGDIIIGYLTVYVGETFIQEFMPVWIGDGSATVCDGVILNSDTFVSGPLGVSLEVYSGINTQSSHRIQLFQVCADMIP